MRTALIGGRVNQSQAERIGGPSLFVCHQKPPNGELYKSCISLPALLASCLLKSLKKIITHVFKNKRYCNYMKTYAGI